jgi:hypothetical protein
MKLMDQLRITLRVRHYAIATEKSYCSGVRKFILFHKKRHPKDMQNRGQNTVFANILVAIRDNKPHRPDKRRANQDLSYLELRNMLYNGVIIVSLVFTPQRQNRAYEQTTSTSWSARAPTCRGRTSRIFCALVY